MRPGGDKKRAHTGNPRTQETRVGERPPTSAYRGHVAKELDVEDAAAEGLPLNLGQGAALVDAEAAAGGVAGEVAANLAPGGEEGKGAG